MSTPATRFTIRLLGVLAMTCILITASVMACRMMATPVDQEHFFYNRYDRKAVDEALTQPDHRLTLHEYVNVMDSTQNLSVMSLQQLAGNMILGCDDPSVRLDTVDDVRKWAKAVAGKAVLDAYVAQDWYRLAMILLKTFDSIAAIDRGYTQWFERTPTNGVYGVESIRMMKDGEWVPFMKLPPVPSAPSAPSALRQSDALFKRYAEEVYPKARDAVMTARECRVNTERAPEKCGYLSIPLFCQLGCVMMFDVFASE